MAWGTYQHQGVNAALLDEQVAAVFPAFDGIETGSFGVRVLYSSEPDQATKDAVDAVVAAHDADAWEPRIYDHVATSGTDFRQIDYRSGLVDRLHRYVDFDDVNCWKRGEVRKVQYYKTPARLTLVLEVSIEYVRHANGLLNRVNDAAVWGDPDFYGRRTIRTWFRRDGTPHPTIKETIKTYDDVETAAEGVRRRQGVFDRLKVVVYGLILAVGGTEADALAYVGKHQANLQNYVETGDNSFRTTGSPNLTADTDWWLDIDIGGGITPRLILLDSTADLLDP